MGSLRDPLPQLSARASLSTQSTECNHSYPPNPILGSKRSPQNRLCPTRSSWKVIVRAGRAISSAPLAPLGISQVAASPGGCPAWSQPGQVPSSRGARAEQDPGTGAPEELPCLPAQRDGFAERGGTPANNKEQRMQRDKRRYLPGNHYKVL